MHWPNIELPQHYESCSTYLKHLVYEGAHKRISDNLPQEYINRIETELKYIEDYDVDRYFIILNDIVCFARKNDIGISAGRGRTVNSIVCFCLFIDDIDPIKFSLNSDALLCKRLRLLPDVDLDVSQSDRNLLVDYIRTKYGKDNILRVKDKLGYAGHLHPCSFFIVPNEVKEGLPIDSIYDEGEQRNVLYTNLYKNDLEALGCINFDFVRASFVDDTRAICKLIEQKYGKIIDLSSLDLNDPEVLALFDSGDVNDIFLFDRIEAKDFLMELQPNSFDDLVALNALCRPGAIRNLPSYINRKKRIEEVPHINEINHILESTYGILIYRDQLIQILIEVGEIAQEDAFPIYVRLIRQKDDIQCEELFLKGCIHKNMSADEGKELWNFIKSSANYAFDKGHATAYTYIAFQQAWLKAYYPKEYQEVKKRKTQLPMTIDKIKGVIYGQAIGDALGLGTEFMDKAEMAQMYPNGLKHYSEIYQDSHRRRWVKGDWTDDTDMMLCIAKAIIDDKGVNLTHIAKNFKDWAEGEPMGIGFHTYKVLTIGDYVDKPFDVAKLIWEMSRRSSAANGGLMRTSIVGLLPNDAEKHAANICRLTHYDPRCVGSCVIVSTLIHSLVYDAQPLTYEKIIEIGNKYDERIEKFVNMAKEGTIDSLELTDEESMGYTLKTLAIALWAYWHCSSFEEGLLTVINAGGDADTNAAVACAILGARFGFESIPKEYVDGLIHREELDKVVEGVMSIVYNN